MNEQILFDKVTTRFGTEIVLFFKKGSYYKPLLVLTQKDITRLNVEWNRVKGDESDLIEGVE